MARLSEKERALLAGGDAPAWLRLKARLAPQDDAAIEVEFAAIRKQMPEFGELPEYFAWEPLAEEMKANILLGVEAGEAVRPRRMPMPLGWRAGLAFACLSLVMVSGYGWQVPRQPAPEVAEAPVFLEAGPGSLGVEQSNNAFAVVFDGNTGQQVLSGGLGSVRADYVDRETGQVTVAHVYMD